MRPSSAKYRSQARPTIYDVARRAAVSPATVSKVLRGVQTVGHDNASRVTQAVRDLGYRGDPLAANLRRNRRAIAGLIIPDFRNPFFGALVSAIEKLAETSGLRLVTVSSSESADMELRQIEALLDWRVAGIIVIPCAASVAAEARLMDAALPAVLLDRVPPGTAFDGISVNNAEACRAMIRYFYDAGHRRILVAASSPDTPNMTERLAGVEDAAAHLPERVAIDLLICGSDLDSATAAMQRRFAQGPPPRAIFTLFIQATLAALREIDRHGLAIPQDISLAGFDDLEWLQVMHPPIASVVQPVELMAKRAWDRLLARVEEPGDAIEHLKLPCHIELRGSISTPGKE